MTNRSNNQEFFYVDQALLWMIFMKSLRELTRQFKCEIHAFVLMSNHYHLMISTPQENLGEAMKYLHREVARQANRSTGRINHFFGGRYKWALICDEVYYWNCLKYLFRNPIRAGICTDVGIYKFSSLNRPTNLLEWRVTDLFENPGRKIELDLNWLNEPFGVESEIAIRKGLRRREFTLTKLAKGRVPVLEAMQKGNCYL